MGSKKMLPSYIRSPGPHDNRVLTYSTHHRRIQDFVRGGARPSWPPLDPRLTIWGSNFCGEGGGGKAPLAPPPGSAPAHGHHLLNIDAMPSPGLQYMSYTISTGGCQPHESCSVSVACHSRADMRTC